MKVVVLMIEKCSSVSVSACLEFLECANVISQMFVSKTSEAAHSPRIQFDVKTASVDGQPVTSTGGMILTPEASIKDIGDVDLVVVPGFMFNVLDALPFISEVVDWLKKANLRGAYIASMCTGAFALAQSGLLDGRFATTHWAFDRLFRKRYPKVKLRTERTVTEDGLLLCSGGATSSSDLLLYIIRKFMGPQISSDCAKNLLVDNVARSQLPFSSTTFNKSHNDARILKSQLWIEKNLSQDFRIETLAEVAGMSLRSFIRRFKAATGLAPIQYVQNMRLERAKHLLETSGESIDQITVNIGYEDVSSFRRMFKNSVGITPGTYRKRFLSISSDRL